MARPYNMNTIVSFSVFALLYIQNSQKSLAMKKLVTVLLTVLTTASIWAQGPEAFSYQAVLRDSNDQLVINTQVGMKISILQGAADGTSVYTETQTPTSNANGLISIETGKGTSSDDFSAIDWSTGTYFIKTEVDLTGGTDYTITGTSQLLSVPFALYASVSDSVVRESQILAIEGNTLSISDGNSVELPDGESQDGGKDFVLFTGDISDSEAAQKVIDEVGVNTRYIYVEYTTQLTSLDLSGARNIIELMVMHNSELTDIQANTIESCYKFHCERNSLLTTISLNSLTYTRDLVMAGCDILTTVSVPILEASRVFAVEECYAIQSIQIPNLTSTYHLQFRDCSVTSLSAPSLEFCQYLRFDDCSSLSSLDISNLRTVLEMNVTGTMLSSIDLSNLTTADQIRINLNSLTSIALSNLGSFTLFAAGGNQLSSEEVNRLLAYFVSVTPSLSGVTISLLNQDPPAPPTGQGISDRATLIANGNTVQTD